MKDIKNIKKWYFTFGDDPVFPFKNGWIVIEATSSTEAREIFSQYYPATDKGFLPFASQYSEDTWFEMNPEENWRGYKCYREIPHDEYLNSAASSVK